MDIGLVSLIVSILTFVFFVLIDLKKITHALFQKNYYDQYFTKLIDQLYISLYIRLYDENQDCRFAYGDKENKNQRILDNYAYLEKIYELIKKYQNIQSNFGGLFVNKINKKIDLLESIYYLSNKIGLQSVTDVMYTNYSASNNIAILENLYGLIQNYKEDDDNDYIHKILRNKILKK